MPTTHQNADRIAMQVALSRALEDAKSHPEMAYEAMRRVVHIPAVWEPVVKQLLDDHCNLYLASLNVRMPREKFQIPGC